MSYALKKGTTSKILLVYALDTTDMRSGKTGLSSRTPDSSAAYIREGEAQVRQIPLVEGTLGEHRAGSFVEVDGKLLPGVYQFGVPDEMPAIWLRGSCGRRCRVADLLEFMQHRRVLSWSAAGKRHGGRPFALLVRAPPFQGDPRPADHKQRDE